MALLRELIRPASLERCGDRSFPVLSMTMHDGIMLQSDRFKKSLASIDQSAYKVVRRDQLVVGFPIDEGVLYIQQVADAGIMSPAYDVWDVDKEKVDLRYFELCLHSPQSMMFYKTNLRGTTARRRSLPKETLLSLSVPVPSMERQREIASAIGRLKELIELRQRQLYTLDTLIKARFVEMFGNPVTNPHGYLVQTLQQLIDSGFITYHLDGNHGGDYPRSEEFVESGVPYIGANCIVNGEINFSMAKYLTEEKAGKLRKGIARDGDVLFAHNATVGPTVVLHTNMPKVILSTSLTAYRCNQNRIKPNYLKAYMQSDGFIRQYSEEMKQTTRNQVPITAQKKYLFLVPPLEDQEKFAIFVDRIDKSKVVVQAALKKAQMLFDSLMQQYFG